MKSDATGNAVQEESKTVHVQSLDRDFAGLYKLFMELPDACRIGYHKNYIFLCFKTPESAKVAVESINKRTSMRARTVEFEYSPHFTPGSLGTPGKIVRMNFITVSPTEAEIRAVFMRHKGFTKLQYTSKKCWATFASIDTASKALQHFNAHTNIKVVFCNNVSGGGKN
ncbi:hypothetical protein HK100_005885 [Physocladia obscura]|uniref:RRM domain-containing protein n=1 Tax=Physocladia obscura TaxID=109957 RepID=A0AAD5X7T9_9FUNG|nr:hypothetical protein HK100_005885 [Physocladia obscura]